MTPLRSRLPLLAVGLAFAGLSQAQAQLGTADNSSPINIQADSGIEWQQNQQLYIARGNAIAVRGPATIKADTLIAHYREVEPGAVVNAASTGNNTEIYRVEADGHVTITRDNRTVVGDHADYDIDQGIGIVRGKALKMTTASDVVTARDALEWYDAKQIAIARGDAVAVHNGRTIKADVLTAYMVKAAPSAEPGKPASPPKPAPPPGKPGVPAAANDEASKIDRIDAQGHVVVVNAADIGRGDYGVYNAGTGICTLLGNVTITRGAEVITGQYAVMNMNTNISRILPASTLPGSTQKRVTGLFVKQDMPGAAGGAAAGAAGSAAAAKPAPAAGKKP